MEMITAAWDSAEPGMPTVMVSLVDEMQEDPHCRAQVRGQRHQHRQDRPEPEQDGPAHERPSERFSGVEGQLDRPRGPERIDHQAGRDEAPDQAEQRPSTRPGMDIDPLFDQPDDNEAVEAELERLEQLISEDSAQPQEAVAEAGTGTAAKAPPPEPDKIVTLFVLAPKGVPFQAGAATLIEPSRDRPG